MPLLIRAVPRDGHELDDHLGAVIALYERGLEINILLHARRW